MNEDLRKDLLTVIDVALKAGGLQVKPHVDRLIIGLLQADNSGETEDSEV